MSKGDLRRWKVPCSWWMGDEQRHGIIVAYGRDEADAKADAVAKLARDGISGSERAVRCGKPYPGDRR